MTHPILFSFMVFFTAASVLGVIVSDNATRRLNTLIDAFIYGYTAYVLWGV